MPISQRNDKIFLISQFLYSLVFMIPVWIVYYQGRITVSQISFLVAMQYAVQLIFELPTGALADMIGRKWTIAIGYFFWSISNLFIIGTTGFPPLVIASFLGGVAESLISGSLEALVYDSHQQDGNKNGFSQVMAKNGFWFQIGLAVATLLGGFLFQFWFGLPWLLYLVTTGIAGVLAFFFIEPKIDSEHFSFSSYFLQMKKGTQEAFKSTEVTLMSLFYVVVAALTWTNNFYFFDYMLVELEFSAQQRSVIGAVMRIFNVFVLMKLLKNDHIFTRNRSILFFPIVMMFCFLPGIFFQGIWALPFIMGTVMVGTARWIILSKYTNEMFESKYRATAISALSMLVGVIFVAIVLASGPLIENYGVRMMYSLLGLLTVITVLPLAVKLVRK